MTKLSKFGRAGMLVAVTLVSGTMGSTVAFAQIVLSPAPINLDGNQVCTESRRLQVSDTEDGCDTAQDVNTITFLSGSTLRTDAGSTAQFNGIANFTNNVQMSGLQAFSGTSAFNSTVTFTGPSVTFGTGTVFNNPADFNAAITTSGISNTGSITTTGLTTVAGTISNLTLGASFTALGGANINMGGNQIHGVAAGTAATDAVNVAQLNAATSGITANITTLQTTVATQGTQISDIQAVNTTQSSQISAIQAVNTTQDTRLTAVESTNTTQATQITAIQAMNTTQSSQISVLEAASASMAGSINTLFDLRSVDRRDMKQGVASAMSMASAPMPSGPGKIAYAVNGATFRGEYAVGGSLQYRLNTENPMAVNVGFSYAGNKNNGVRVGIAGEF